MSQTDSRQANAQRGIFCNRTLNLQSIRAIGYDMDYTLIHYRVEEWERRAYEHLRAKLVDMGWPVDDLTFDPTRVVRGLIIDTELGNIVKADRFGYVKRAAHGTTPLGFETQRKLYGRTMVELGEGRFEFLNTLFSLSEATMYAQLVDRLDAGKLPDALGYHDVHRIVKSALDEAHVEGILKAEIIADPDRFVELDSELPLALLDQKHAGKKILLITNSEWHYTNAMMAYAFDRFVPSGSWRDLFDLVIVSARKPGFFSGTSPFFEVVNDEGLLRPTIRGPHGPGIFLGGHAGAIERFLGLSGDQILYVGDHIFSDVKVSKSILRWRTALILRELEREIADTTGFEATQQQLTRLMAEKRDFEQRRSKIRLLLQRIRVGYGPDTSRSQQQLESEMNRVREDRMRLDERIAELAVAAGEIGNVFWGPIMRAGNDKSHLARQVERSADIYTSRVSNFLAHTPFLYMRAPRGSLPHDPDGRNVHGDLDEL